MIIFKFTLSRKSLQNRVMKKEIAKQIDDYKIDLCWWDKVKIEKCSIKSLDGLNLVGYFIERNSDKTAIVVHGFGGNYKDMQQHCKMFYDRNFNILAVENRAHGESEGRCVGFGFLDRLDLLKWIEFLNEKNPEAQIVMFGLSMGGTAVCSLAGENLPNNVVAIISDCAFSNGDKQISYVIRKYKGIGKILKKHLYSYIKNLHSFDMMQVDAVKSVKNTKIPILFIHGDCDKFVPVENLYDLFNATPENLREKYIVEGATHGMAYSVAGVLYEKKIMDFLKNRTKI